MDETIFANVFVSAGRVFFVRLFLGAGVAHGMVRPKGRIKDRVDIIKRAKEERQAENF